MKSALFIFLCFFLPFHLLASYSDSLDNVLEKASSDLQKARILKEFLIQKEVKLPNAENDKWISMAFYFAQKSEKAENMAWYYNAMGRFFYRISDFKKASAYFLRSAAIYDSLYNNKELTATSINLGNSFRSHNDFKRGAGYFYKALSNSISLKDSMNHENTTHDRAEMDAKYQTTSKNQQIEIQKAEISRRGIIIYTSIAFFALVLLAGIFAYFNNRKIRKLNKNLAALNILKDKLFSIISHDLRAPLSNTMALLELVSQEEISPNELKRFSITLLDILQHNLQLLDNLLNWAGSQTRGLMINKNTIKLQNLVDEHMQAIQGAASKKNVQLKETGTTDAKVYADLNMTRLILRNLLSNALKYTPAGGSITISFHIEDKNIKVSIADTGIGIAEDMKNALFSDAMVQSQPGTNDEKGFGIGLMLCKEFIEKNGGRLIIESKSGQGSIFSFTLPLAA